MDYDEDLLVELIACGDVSQTEIAERVGVSRRTVWRIANGHSRPDLQTRIADTVEGFRRETIRMAAKWMKPLLTKQIKVALEGDGETARKCREFLLSRMLDFPLKETARLTKLAKQTKKRKNDEDEDPPIDRTAVLRILPKLSTELKEQMCIELGLSRPNDYQGAEEQRLSTTESTEVEEATATDDSLGVSEGNEEPVPAPPQPGPDDPVSDREGEEGKDPRDPFANFVDGPFGKKVYAASIRAVEEAKAEAEASSRKKKSP